MREQIDRLARDRDEALALARVLDLADQAIRQGQRAGDFMEPRLQELAARLLTGYHEIELTWQGGYEGAERRRLVLHDPGVIPATEFALVVVTANREIVHRDCLGSLLGLGLRREKVGDILPAGNTCYIVIASEIREFILENLFRVGRQEVAVTLTDTLEGLMVTEPRIISGTVASLRLDAIIATGLNLARAEAQNLVKTEKVRLNYREETRPEHIIKEGDLISVRGHGRLKLVEIAGKSRKDRVRITLERY